MDFFNGDFFINPKKMKEKMKNDKKEPVKHKPRCPFPWFGGKGQPRIKNAILKSLPPHQKYIEPFGGGASVLLAKEPCEVDVYNDVNRGLVNFFRVIADNDLFPRFMQRVGTLPTSRELFEEYARTWSGIHDPLEQAIRWFYSQRLSFSGTGTSFGISLQGTVKSGAQSISSFRSALDALEPVHDRMQRTVIECMDWRNALECYNGPEWLAYCDPPYVLGARKAGGYAHELQDKDHEELIQRLLNYKGSVVLSGYNSELYQPLLDAGWDFLTVEVCCTAAGRTRASGLQGKGNVLAKQKRTECIWRNPHAMKLIADSAQ